MGDRIINFIKFGSEKNVLELFENGTLFCNTFDYFKRIEGDCFRGDKYEGTYEISNKIPHSFKIGINGSEFSFPLTKFHLKKEYNDIHANLFCLTAIVYEEVELLGSLTLDSKISKFGSHFLIINNPKLFFEKIKFAFEKNGLKYFCGLVTYYNELDVNGDINPFQKRNEYSYQKEFRIMIENDSMEALKIEVGSLNEISRIYPIEALETIRYFI